MLINSGEQNIFLQIFRTLIAKKKEVLAQKHLSWFGSILQRPVRRKRTVSRSCDATYSLKKKKDPG